MVETPHKGYISITQGLEWKIKTYPNNASKNQNHLPLFHKNEQKTTYSRQHTQPIANVLAKDFDAYNAVFVYTTKKPRYFSQNTPKHIVLCKPPFHAKINPAQYNPIPTKFAIFVGNIYSYYVWNQSHKI